MTNKTAVEWLIEQLECRLESLPEHKLFDQAIKMEKEQIMNAATWGALHESGEKYYNETYGK